MSNFAGPQFPMLKEMFPQFKFVFMTRMPNKVIAVKLMATGGVIKKDVKFQPN